MSKRLGSRNSEVFKCDIRSAYKLPKYKKAYNAWNALRLRCLDGGYKQSHKPTYVGCAVDPEWFIFSAFFDWWSARYFDGCAVDKDLLIVGNKIYGPNTCVLVPLWLNNFTTVNASARNHGLGVTARKSGRFQASVNHPKTKKLEHLGTFQTAEQAHTAWLTRKLEIAAELKDEIEAVHVGLYDCVVAKIKSLE